MIKVFLVKHCILFYLAKEEVVIIQDNKDILLVEKQDGIEM